MMEERLESSALEDNLDMGLGFGNDIQKTEKLNQSFLLLKKKLFRSHDLIQQYSNKMKECERLRIELETCQRDSERFKQQHLTATAKTVKLTMENTKLQELNKKLEKLVAEHETQIAGDQRLVQQLSCKVEDIEDRHSERVMQIELEKSVLQTKVKELEQEIKKISKSHEKKSPKKVTKKLAKASPFKSRGPPAGLGLIADDEPFSDAVKKSPEHQGSDEFDKNIIDDFSELPRIDFPKEQGKKTQKFTSDENDKYTKESGEIESNQDNKIFQKSTREIGVNVDISISPSKPVTMDKNIMTDEFYNLTDNPYPLFCAKCENLLEKSLDDLICRATKLPPNIPKLPPSPLRSVRAIQSPEKDKFEHPVILDSLQRRVKLLEKRMRRQKKAEIFKKSSCCNHSQSLGHCNQKNSFKEPFQFDMMTEFFGRMMQLPGFQGLRSRRDSVKSRRRLSSMRMKDRWRTEKRNLSSDTWDIESDEERRGLDESNAFPRPRASFRATLRNGEQDYDEDPEDDFFNSMPSNRLGRRRRETLRKITEECGGRSQGRSPERLEPKGNFNSTSLDRTGRRRPSLKDIINSPRASSPKRRHETPPSLERVDRPRKQTVRAFEESIAPPREPSSSPEPERNYIHEGNLVPSTCEKRKRTASSSSQIPEETIPKRKKRTDDPPKPISVRSNLLKNLRRLKKDKAAVKTISTSVNRDERNEVNVTQQVTQQDLPGPKKRIAHVPKQPELPCPSNIIEDDRRKLPEISISANVGEKRITRSLRKFSVDTHKNDLGSTTDSAPNQPNPPIPKRQEETILQVEPTSEKTLEVINEGFNLMIDEPSVPSNGESPASPTGETPASPSGEPSEILPETIKIPLIYETAAVSDYSDSEPLQNPSNCVRELRNRQIHVSPVKQKNSFFKEPMEPLVSPLPLPLSPLSSPSLPSTSRSQVPQNIEDLLDNWLVTSKKRRGRKPKALEVSKILQSKAENLIKQDLTRLLESPDWDNALHTRVSTQMLNTKSPRTVAKAILDFLIDRSATGEPLDLTYTPPAPPMTKSLQRIVTLLKDLDSKIPELINFVFQGIEYALFRLNATPTWETVEELSKLFTVLARIRKDRERVRIMCCDAVYGLQKRSLIVLHAVLTCWPEVLPLYDADKDQYLPISIAHTIRSQAVNDNSKCEQVKKLIKGYFKYPQNDPPEVLGNKLLEALGRNYDKSVETAILLLAKREGTDWTHKNVIQGGLMPMIVEGKCSEIYHSLKLLGFLLRPFPIFDKDGAVKKIVEQLRALAEADTGSVDLQEGAISALMSLSRHRFEDVAGSVLSWRPTRALPELLHEQINAFFASRGSYWNHIKAKNRKHAAGL
ncbi:uncharacterized protein LOC135163437 [Diachasmimorpha longicaudata]|uniref:uncharacterized protein LOC135163437 n=1 Tax=Diachasmimorpha longicaudata TaxID=58733 RepID=UPI0030B89AA0